MSAVELLGILHTGQPIFSHWDEEVAQLEEDLFYCYTKNCACRLEEMN